MKKIFLFWLVVSTLNNLAAQNLVTVSTDLVGFDDYPSSPFLVQSGPDQFYWISSSYYSFVDHPLLNDVSLDYPNVFFIKYDKEGNPLYSQHIRGSSNLVEAVSHGDGLLLLTRASEDVDASGTLIPIGNEGRMEILAWYDGEGKLARLASIWSLQPDQWVSSGMATSPADGSVYVFGTAEQPLAIRGNELIGTEWGNDYIYLLKYSQDLVYQWHYTAGFDTTGQGSDYAGDLRVFSDAMGHVWLSGKYESDSPLRFSGESLDPIPDGTGLFLVNLDPDGHLQWTRKGIAGGYSSGTYLDKGYPMKNGDMVLTGVTTTGYFQLGDTEYIFEGPQGRAYYFVQRLRPDGSEVWSTTFAAAGRSFSEEKKGAMEQLSDRFEEDFMFDAVNYKNRVLYVSGSYLSDSFRVAGEPLPKKYEQGLFVSAVNLESGEQEWGYGLSSVNSCLHGFDTDAAGNVTLMGCTEGGQFFDGIGEDISFDGRRVFLLGLDFNGVPLWYNNALLRNYDYSLYGVDLEVLQGGELFSSLYQTETDNLELGGSNLDTRDYSFASWLVSLKADNELGGKVLDPTGMPVYPGVVNAYRTSRSGAYPLVSTVPLNENGEYLFTRLYPSRYTLQVVPDPVVYPKEIPTYLGNGTSWSIAQFNQFETDTRASFLDIQVNALPVQSGEGNNSLMGSVVYEEEGARKATLARPVKKASILVVVRDKKSTANEQVIAYVETDDLGQFQFEEVPDGVYTLLVDIPGLEMIESHNVAIESNELVTGLDYTVGEEGIYTFTGVGVSEREKPELRIFPVPGNGMIHLEIPGDGPYRAEVYATDGRKVFSRHWEGAAGMGTLDISGQPPGVYLIRLRDERGSATARYLKE